MRPTSLWEYLPNWTLLIFNILLLFGKVFCSPRDHNYDYYPSPRPTFLSGETNFTFHKGDTATLRCGVMDLGTKTVSWRRDSSLQPLAIGEMIFSSNTDYKIHHPDKSPYWNLLIKNVQPKHADTYECQISTSDKMKRRVYLNVLDDDTFRKPVINISGLFHVDKGQSIKLLCNATGTSAPPDIIDWYKDGIQLQSNEKKMVTITKKFSYATRKMSSELEIKNAKMSDKGTYTCRTSDLQVTSVNVNILNAEKPKIKRVPEDEKPQATIYKGNSNGCSRKQNEYSHKLLLVTSTLFVVYLMLWSHDAS
ncbi:roundabout homolog 2-like isoform X2 [Ruditapes philippinarum]|uniref:roundabout homolog 2-like isoform X2 n=1 Tax=Ruditapes philippinarum TaxID=129788 RepID=UPI00295BE0CF|nr:roundabout homolog 2-like isoform X2 [Ruditapes philippinarum]